MLKSWFAPGLAVILTAIGLSLTAPATAQGVSRVERLEGKLRVAIIKTLKDIKAPLIKAGELKAIIDDTNLILIDVRQPREQEVSMLPHALTTSQFAAIYAPGIPKHKRLVVYCTIGYRSGKYAAELSKQGIKAENLEGGVLAWSFAGGKFRVKDAKGDWMETNRIHVYDPEWNIVHPDYVGVVH
ncbi:MAG: rhodanese-like domain-containing protein [Fibrobacterota bacterium]|nr:rhodanese-like domain-containing protein [Fibrobacterota bacterium]